MDSTTKQLLRRKNVLNPNNWSNCIKYKNKNKNKKPFSFLENKCVSRHFN